MEQYTKHILTSRVYDIAKETPLDYAPALSARLENHVLLKREDLQQVFSFKLRGAYNKISALPASERAKGVIAASAGNHAQGVALAAGKLAIRSLIVMPKTTPEIKISSVRNLGGEIVLHGSSYDDAYNHAMKLASEQKMTFIHPYDDEQVIAGQGTVAMEILRQHSGQLDALFIPVGGGGLIAGMAAYVKYLRPDIKIIGVEPDDAPSMQQALAQGKRVCLEQVGIFADGVAVRQIGKEPFRIARQCVDEMVLVNTDEICAAIKDIFDDTRTIAEPAGALAVAGVKKYIQQEKIRGQQLVAVLSGANMNFDRLRHVAERAELGEQREALIAVTIPEQPGSFRKFCSVIGLRAITEFNYRYSDPETAHVFAGVQMQSGESEKDELIRRLLAEGYPVVDMSRNEMAKMHVRYMVGGHAVQADHELLYRFEFPERPGALLRFLTRMGQRWNISLFHYRNHGADFGRILVGVQVPPPERKKFSLFLEELGYNYREETENPAYKLFLK